jgi:hypothetical protein
MSALSALESSGFGGLFIVAIGLFVLGPVAVLYKTRPLMPWHGLNGSGLGKSS